MKKYYLHNGTEQDGPFDVSDLKSKGIKEKTEVWYEGLADWTTADQIDELKVLFQKTTPPPIKPKSTKNKSQPTPAPKKSKVGKNILTLILITIGVVGGFTLITSILDSSSDTNPANYFEQKMTIGEIEDADPKRFLSAGGKYNESFWGTELKIRGEITNTATVADYKDVTVQVTYYSKTNSVLTTKNYTLYEVYQPNTVTAFRLDIENYKDVDSIGWEVTSALPN